MAGARPLRLVRPDMSGFMTGFRAPLAGFGLIIKPGIRLYVLIPLVVNTLLFTAVIVFGIQAIGDLIDRLSGQWAWLEWIAWILWPLFLVVALTVVFFTFSIVINLIGAPFNGFLSAAVERHLTGRQPVDYGGLPGITAEIASALKSEARKFLYFFLRALPLLLLFFIPFLAVAAPLIWFAFAAWMMAIEYMDYPMGNRGMLFDEIRRELAARKQLALGFGAGTLILTMIPVLNFVAMPVAVAGATRLYLQDFQPPPRQ